MPLDFTKMKMVEAGIGHNSGLTPLTDHDIDIIENRDISNQVIIQSWRRMLDCMHQIPAKFLYAVIGNKENCECCRKAENLSLEIRKTQACVMQADLYVIECDCKRQHIRVLGEPGHFGDPSKSPKYILNPLFKEPENAETNA